jgi:hypothetical protein
METLLKDNREKVGYASFDDFRGSNVAVFRYYVLKPEATAVTKLTIVDGPLYEASVNRSNALHSEVIILGMLQDIQKSDTFKRNTVRVTRSMWTRCCQKGRPVFNVRLP